MHKRGVGRPTHVLRFRFLELVTTNDNRLTDRALRHTLIIHVTYVLSLALGTTLSYLHVHTFIYVNTIHVINVTYDASTQPRR